MLPAWGYHVREDYIGVSNLFLSMHAGLWLAVPLARRLLAGRPAAGLLAAGCAIVCAGFLLLATLRPGAAEWWRLLCTLGVGMGAGLVNRGAFQAISMLYQRDPAATVNLAGVFFGAGTVLVSLLVAGTYYVYTVSSILVWIALIPGFFAGMYFKATRGARAEEPGLPERLGTGWEQTRDALKTPLAVLLALLLFFQFANEWSIGGWLPLLLTKRIGVSPAAALIMLALYWLALMVGRAGVAALLERVPHGRLLGLSSLAAFFGCVVLASTNNRFGAVAGILFLGGGFASVFPLAVERIKDYFPSYHPGFFNGVFSLAASGGLLAPWSLGFLVKHWGARAVIAVPLVGTWVVVILVILLRAEAKLARYL